MKKLVLISVIFVVLCAISLTIVNAVAEEPAEIPSVSKTEIVEESSEMPNNSDTKELENKLAIAVAKLNELTGEDNYFKNKVLPYLINGGADLIIIGIFVLRPYLKKKSLADKLTVAAAQLKAENENLNTILNSTDPEKIKEAFGALMGDNLGAILKGVKEEFAGYYKAVAELKTIAETEYSLLKNFIEAARQAWASKPEVVALLAESPTKSTLEDLIEYNEKLKNYIRELKGEEAEETLKTLSV